MVAVQGLRQNNQTAPHQVQVSDYRSAGLDPCGYIDVYFYDREGRTLIKASRLSATPDVVGNRFTMAYDGFNRLSSVTDAQGAVVGYTTYDAASNLKVLTYPDGKTVTYTYDALNRMKTVSIDWLSELATYFYDDAGRLTGISQFNGTMVTPGYDNANRLTSLTNYSNGGSTTITGYGYTLDNNGNRTQVSATGALPPANATQDVSYEYTPHGNRLTNFSSAVLTFDSDGQLQNNGSTAYTFDGAHRLTGYGTSSFSYDGANRRLKATRAGTTNKYVYDASGNLLVQEDANGNILKYFIYGKGLLAWVDASGNLYCYHFDGNGNTVAVTDINQKVVNKYSYTPYGVIDGRIETKPQPFTYVGQFGVFDEGSGIYYMRARYYDANAKRFISEDPKGFDGGDVNFYVYAANNPLVTIDPDGEGLRGPDYYAFTFSAGTYTFLGVVDSYGSVYISPLGSNVGKAITPVSVSGTAGWLMQWSDPTSEELQSFLTGKGLNIMAGDWVGGGISYSPGNGISLELGAVTPQIGVSNSYSFMARNGVSSPAQSPAASSFSIGGGK